MASAVVDHQETQHIGMLAAILGLRLAPLPAELKVGQALGLAAVPAGTRTTRVLARDHQIWLMKTTGETDD